MENKEFLVRGTLGDTYIACCKLLAMGDASLTIWHSTQHKYWTQKIHDIYGLVPNINPLFVSYPPRWMPEITSDVHEGEMVWFPEWNWPSRIKYTDIQGDYLVIQPEAGKPKGFNHKELKHTLIYNELNKSSLPVVIIGTTGKYESIRCQYNLSKKTELLDAMRIVSKAKRFIGPEGLMAFVALSHKVKSEIYYTSNIAVETRLLNSPWEQYCWELAYMGSYNSFN